MPTVRYTANNFGSRWGKALSGTHNLGIPWHEMVWAAISVGKPGIAHLFTHGWHSISDVIVRSHTIYANLCQSSGMFERSTLYQDLDPSEKGAASYFLGMVAAKILCDRLLDTPWMLHLSMFQAAGGSVVLKGKSQPDLIGIDRVGRWTVAEAKGRSNNLSPAAMRKAKDQTSRLRNINGSLPKVRVAVQAYFAPQLSFAIDDPEEIDEAPVDVIVSENDAIRQYYSYPLEAARNPTRRETVLNRQFDMTDISEVGVSIGLSSEVREALESDAPVSFAILRDRVPQREYGDDRGLAIFSDGIAIELDGRWDEELMGNEPGKRLDG